MLLNENKHNKLKEMIIRSSQNNDNDHNNTMLAGANRHKHAAIIDTTINATTEKPTNFPK